MNMALIPVLTGYDWDFPVIKTYFGAAVYNEVLNFSKANPSDINNLWYSIVGYQLLSNFFLNAITPNITTFVKIVVYNMISACSMCCGSIYIEDD